MVGGCKLSKFRMKTSYYAMYNCFHETSGAKSLRFYHDNITMASWDLKEEEVDFNFKMSTDKVEETFPTFAAVENVNLNVCDGTKYADGEGDAAKVLARLCDPIDGFSMSMCVGPSGKSCAMSFREWGGLLVKGYEEVLAQNAVMDDFNESYIFYDFEKLTLTGFDNRPGQNAKEENTVLFLGKVITEIMRKKKTEEGPIKTYFGKPKWSEIEPKVSESVYYYILSSPYVNITTMNRAMGLTSGFDIFAQDPYEDSMTKKNTVLNNSGYYTIMEIINLDKDYAASKTALGTIKTAAIFQELAIDKTKPMIISPKDLPAPDI